MNKKNIILSLFIGTLLTFVMPLCAQNQTVTGLVVDVSGEPIIGATVMVVNGTVGTVTDIDGKFNIKVAPKSKLKVSFVGYTSQIISDLKNPRIVLLEDQLKLDEVVVLGDYGSQKLRNATGAIETISTEELKDLSVGSLGDALAGKINGLHVSLSGGRPGSTPSLQIRQSSVNTTITPSSDLGGNASPTPLYVIDGFIADEGAFNNLDINEVENVTVLKDAAAAVYGARAAYGVVLVKTKQGKVGAPKISYSGQFGYTDALMLPKMLNAYDYGRIYNAARAANTATKDQESDDLRVQLFQSDELEAMKGMNYNLLDKEWSAALTQRHSVNISGGTEKATYFGGVSYYQQEGNIGRLDYNRWNYRAGVNANISKWMKASASSDPLVRDTLKYAKMLEGNVRGTGVHACGTIICRDDITDWVPVSTADDKETGEKMLVTQYEGSVIEDTGLIKMDFLGLKTLSIIKEAVENIRLSRSLEIDVDQIDITDPATYKLYSDGRTIGTFQFESAGMQKYLRELQPSTFEDLIAMNALYRPGPMDYIPDFIDRKHGRKPIEYDIPVMEKYLKDTYGITVYQEQVMLLSRLLADFTRGESDALRKAMGKKLRDKLDHMKPKFIEGGRKNGHDPKVLEKIWTDWEKFASYAFNKSHATCYSWVAYQTAYLKANYPSEYMAAVMSRSLSNITDITKLMDECKAMGIQTLGPDVNESNLKFTVNHDGNIRFGLGAVKGVGEAAVQSIVEERNTNGPFKGIFDFVQRVNLNACNKKNMECLALAGGFDSFPELKREQYFAVNSKGEVFLETLMRYGNRYQEDKRAAINSLFGGANVVDIATPEIPQGVERWGDLERLNKERDLVGIYLSAHPLDEFAIVLDHVCNTRMADLEDKAALAGREITMGGIVTSVRRGVSKNGNPYGIAKIEDYSGSTEIPFWGNDWVTYQGYLNEGTFLYIKARCQAKQWRQDELEVKITSMELLPDVKEELVQKITIIIPLSVLNSGLVTELATLTKEHPGNTELYFKVTDDTDSRMSVDLISRPVKLSVGRDLITYLKERPELGFRIN